MSEKYVLLTDSNSEVPYVFAKEHKIDFIKMPYTIDDEEFYYDLGEKTDYKAFFKKVRNGSMPKTSTFPPQFYVDKLMPYLQDGKDILFLSFSSQLSSAFNYLKVACDELRRSFPDRTIAEVDTLRISAPMALLVMKAYELKEEGKSLDEVKNWVEENKLKYKTFFTVDDLHHLRRGGRVSGAVAAVGTMLSIKPFLNINDQGQIVQFAKEKGRKKSINKLAELIEEGIENKEDGTVIILHADCLEEANVLKKQVEEKLNLKKIIVQDIGPVIGTHCGPGTLCVSYRGK